MRDFGMVAMCSINLICFSLTHITCIRLIHMEFIFSARYCILFFFPFSNEIIEPRIWAGCIIRWVAKVDNIFIFTNREAFNFL